MQIKFGTDTKQPIYHQLVESIENDILKGILEDEMKIPSIIKISETRKISGSTVSRSINILIKKGILYMKRGKGFFVSTGAQQKIYEDRKESFFKNYVMKLLNEAQKLNISKQEIIALIEKAGYEHD